MSKTTQTVLVVGIIAAVGGGAYYLYMKQKREAVNGSVSGSTSNLQTVNANQQANKTAQVISAATDSLEALSNIISRNFGSN